MAGVDIFLEGKTINALIRGIKSVKKCHRRGFGSILFAHGGFTGIIEFGEYALALCTDGVGTKILIANAINKYDTIGIDCIAMNVNDMICIGAEPIAFVDYLAMAEPDDNIAFEIGQGLGIGADEANIEIVGGETATLNEIINGLDLAGTALGYVKKTEIINPDTIQAGDVIIGLESSGIHSNGYTLVRRVIETAGFNYEDPLPEDYKKLSLTHGFRYQYKTIGEMLLEPTRIYVRPIMTLIKKYHKWIHGIAHVTGGGLRNLARLNSNYDYHITEIPFYNPVFEWIQGLGKIETKEMYQTFNMGLGMCIIVAKEKSRDILSELQTMVPYNVAIIGQILSGQGCVIYEAKDIEYKGYV